MTWFSPSQYAKKDSETGRWRAGPRSEKYAEGQFVPESYAKKVRKKSKRERLVSNVRVDNPDMEEAEIRERVEKYLDEYEQVTESIDDAIKREAELRRIRERYLY